MNTHRFPPIPYDELSDENKELYKLYEDTTKRGFGENGKPFYFQRTTDNAFIGPFAVFNSCPAIARGFLDMVSALGKFSTSTGTISPTAREIVIIATGARFEAAYELYSHIRIAEHSTELSKEQADVLSEGRKPEGLDHQGSVAYDIVAELLDKKGPLGDEMWAKGVEAFGGKEAVLSLIQYCAVYSYVSVLLNGCDVPLPEGETLR